MGIYPPSALAAPGDAIVAGNSGSARWTIPIEVPPGPGGLAPKLALVYSSSAGDSPFGVGWSLPLGEIACSVRYGVPEYINGATGFDCPWFELDGELLVYDWGEDRYHTFVESFQRIKRLRATTGEWVVTSPDGTIRHYGQTTNSRIVAPSGKDARWLLSSIEDPYGNQISFSYDGDPSDADFDLPVMIDGERNGHTYIKQISWAGGDRVVEFDYEERPDPIHDYAGGILRNIAYRATEIRVTSLGSLHSRHVLGYDLDEIWKAPAASWYSTQRSRLSWAKRFGTDGSALPAQEFRYSDPKDSGVAHWVNPLEGTTPANTGVNTGWNGEPLVWPPPRYNMGPVPTARRMADVNGDGLLDYVIASHLGPSYNNRVRLNTGSGWGAQSGTDLAVEEAAYTASLQGLTFSAPKVKVTFEYDEWFSNYYICDATRELVDVTVSFNISDIGNHFYEVNSWSVQFQPTMGAPGEGQVNPSEHQLIGNFELVDLDGDQRADLVMSVRLSGVHKTWSSCDPGTGTLVNPPEEILAPITVRVAFRNTGSGWERYDSLADGLPPFQMLVMESLGYVWLQTGGNNEGCMGMLGIYFQTPGEGLMGIAPCINHISLDPTFTDLNGDGRLDLIAAVPNNPDVLFVHNRWANLHPSFSFPADGRSYGWHSNTRSLAYVSQQNGGWQRAPASTSRSTMSTCTPPK